MFTRAGSDIRSIEDLAGRSIAMVRTTTAGNLFPMCLLRERGLLTGPGRPRIHWAGTHDDSIRAVAEGLVDAGAAKDLRVDAWEAAGGEPMRRLALSEAVPANALVVRGDLDATLVRRLEQALLAMDQDEAGHAVLALFGADRFVPCAIEQYAAVHDMVEQIGDAWDQVGVSGPPPSRRHVAVPK